MDLLSTTPEGSLPTTTFEKTPHSGPTTTQVLRITAFKKTPHSGPTTTQGIVTEEKDTIIIAISVAIGSIMILLALIIFIWRRKNKKKTSGDHVQGLHQFSLKRMHETQAQQDLINSNNATGGADASDMKKTKLMVDLNTKGKNPTEVRQKSSLNKDRLRGAERNSINNRYQTSVRSNRTSHLTEITENKEALDTDGDYSCLDDVNTYDKLYDVLDDHLFPPEDNAPRETSAYDHIGRQVATVVPIFRPVVIPDNTEVETTVDIENTDETCHGGYDHIVRDAGNVKIVRPASHSTKPLDSEDIRRELSAIDHDDDSDVANQYELPADVVLDKWDTVENTYDENPYDEAADVQVGDPHAMTDAENPYDQPIDVLRSSQGQFERREGDEFIYRNELLAPQEQPVHNGNDEAKYVNSPSRVKAALDGSMEGEPSVMSKISERNYQNVRNGSDHVVQLPIGIKQSQNYENHVNKNDEVVRLPNGMLIADNDLYEETPLENTLSSERKRSNYENFENGIKNEDQIHNDDAFLKKGQLTETISTKSNQSQNFKNLENENDGVVRLPNGMLIADNNLYEETPREKILSSERKPSYSYENFGNGMKYDDQIHNDDVFLKESQVTEAISKKSKQSKKSENYENENDGVVRLPNGSLIAENDLYEKIPAEKSISAMPKQSINYENVGNESKKIAIDTEGRSRELVFHEKNTELCSRDELSAFKSRDSTTNI